MRITPLAGAALAAATFCAPAALPQSSASPNELRPPSAFAAVSDPAERSRALFAEAAKVLTSPRCMNCHPAGDHPLQGDDHHIHQPPVWRGADGAGGSVSGAGRISLMRAGASSFRLDLKGFRLIDNDIATAAASGQATISRDADGVVKLTGALNEILGAWSGVKITPMFGRWGYFVGPRLFACFRRTRRRISAN